MQKATHSANWSLFLLGTGAWPGWRKWRPSTQNTILTETPDPSTVRDSATMVTELPQLKFKSCRYTSQDQGTDTDPFMFSEMLVTVTRLRLFRFLFLFLSDLVSYSSYCICLGHLRRQMHASLFLNTSPHLSQGSILEMTSTESKKFSFFLLYILSAH